MDTVPAIVYTNNIGTLEIQRATYSIADQWSWDNGVVKHTKSIHVSGYLARTKKTSDSESYETVVTNIFTQDGSKNPTTGSEGELTFNTDLGGEMLPWLKLSGIRIDAIATPDSAWLQYMPITIDFSDEQPDGNEYALDLFGIEIIDPVISIELPYRSISDDFVQMPIQSFTQTQIRSGDPAFDAVRQIGTFDNIVMTISGTAQIPDTETEWDVQKIVGTLTQRGGDFDVMPNDYPVGYPRVFNMEDINTLLAERIPYRKIIVTAVDIVVDVDKCVYRVTVTMECLPQRLV